MSITEISALSDNLTELRDQTSGLLRTKIDGAIDALSLIIEESVKKTTILYNDGKDKPFRAISGKYKEYVITEPMVIRVHGDNVVVEDIYNTGTIKDK